MQICMEMATSGRQLFLDDLKRRMRERGWNISRLAKESGVHQSQVSRIVAGDFKTLGSNVIKICITFGMEPSNYYGESRADEDRRQIADSALSIWDGTHRDTGVVVSLLQEIAKLRKSNPRR
jgi:transcriptional regulator with XRE-family HTH domain